MTALSDVPLSTIPWLIGSAGTLIIGFKSLVRYHQSHVELSKYIGWFALLVGTAMAFFSVPTFFTLSTSILKPYDVAGEFFFYCSMVAQAAIVWFLLLRSRLSVYYLAVPVALIGFASWLYAALKVNLVLDKNFIVYRDPRLSTLVIAVLMIALYTPVGIYFLRLVPSQKGLKSLLNALAFGVVYIGTAFISGGFELVTGQMVTRRSVPGLVAFFAILLLAAAWPRRLDAKSSIQLPAPPSSPTAVPPTENTPET